MALTFCGHVRGCRDGERGSAAEIGRSWSSSPGDITVAGAGRREKDRVRQGAGVVGSWRRGRVAIVDQLEQSKQAGLRREAERQAQEIKNLQAELQSRKPQK